MAEFLEKLDWLGDLAVLIVFVRVVDSFEDTAPKLLLMPEFLENCPPAFGDFALETLFGDLLREKVFGTARLSFEPSTGAPSDLREAPGMKWKLSSYNETNLVLP